MLGTIQIELIIGFLSFLFTVLILSYLIGDNPAFRFAIHAFLGVSAGYIAVIVLKQVVVNKMLLPLLTSTSLQERIPLTFPLLLSLLLLGKSSVNSEWVGRPIIAMLVGIGAASAVAGALLGTLFPQILSTAELFDLSANLTLGSTANNFLSAVLILLGTIVTVAYFQFTIFGKNKTTGKRGWLGNIIVLIGQIFIAITLGTIFAGVLTASLTALVDRIQSIILFFYQLLSTFIN